MKTLTFNQLVRDLGAMRRDEAKKAARLIKPEQATKTFLERQKEIQEFKKSHLNRSK